MLFTDQNGEVKGGDVVRVCEEARHPVCIF